MLITCLEGSVAPQRVKNHRVKEVRDQQGD